MAFRFSGCYTAVITPFDEALVDWEAIRQLADFQRAQGVQGVVPAGTTGESPTLTWDEHHRVIEAYLEEVGANVETVAGTGSNSTDESLEATRRVADEGITAVLLVDPYYNGPSSLEIRREYYEPIARAFPEVQVIPYIIPGRTGTQMLPQDLAILSRDCSNVTCVKEATGSEENARLTRTLCGPGFSIMSGDDDRTLAMMRDGAIDSSGVISVISNVVPGAVQRMTAAALAKDWTTADSMGRALQPLFGLVTVKVDEPTPFGSVPVKSRNPVGVKTMMNVLGMPAGPARRPLGRVSRGGMAVILNALRKVWANNPEILEPIERAFDVDIADRLENTKYIEGLFYDGY